MNNGYFIFMYHIVINHQKINNNIGISKGIMSSSQSNNNMEPPIQRALIFQGGGALGAYEAGVFNALYYKLFDISRKEKLFDIVSGTSAGAINATLLVNHVKKMEVGRDLQNCHANSGRMYPQILGSMKTHS